MIEHLSQPEGFVLLGTYLCGTWMFNLMPASYYSFEGSIDWKAVFAQLLLQDAVQCCMHFGEHKIHAKIYQYSHKPHHRFTNPKLFDAFNGSVADTFFMILVRRTWAVVMYSFCLRNSLLVWLVSLPTRHSHMVRCRSTSLP